MTVAAKPPRILYAENGVTVSFPVPFRYKSTADIDVARVAADGSETALRLGVDYSLSLGNTDAGGTLTVPIAANTSKLRIARSTPWSQGTVYTTGDRFPAKTTEGSFDTAMLISQEIGADLDDTKSRTASVPSGEAIGALPAFARRFSKLPTWNAIGDFDTLAPIPAHQALVTVNGLGAPAAMTLELITGTPNNGDFPGGVDDGTASGGASGVGSIFDGGIDGAI